MEKLVTIVIPIFNVEKYLERCIDSVINQTYKNIKIILVDDGSTDKSGEICEKWKKIDNRIEVIHKINGGLSSARNAGIEKSEGEYLVFIDSDDYIDSLYVEEMLKALVLNDSDIVICNRIHFFDDGHSFVKYKMTNDYLNLNSEEAIKEMNYYKYFDMSAPCKLYKRSLFDKIRFPEGKLSEDLFIMYKIFDLANKITYVSKALYYYYQRSGSISKKPKLNHDFVLAAKEQMEYVLKKYPNLEYCVKAAYAISNMTIYNAVITNGGKVLPEEKKKMVSIVKKYIKYILKNKEINTIRKIQSILFISSVPLYNFAIKKYKETK